MYLILYMYIYIYIRFPEFPFSQSPAKSPSDLDFARRLSQVVMVNLWISYAIFIEKWWISVVYNSKNNWEHGELTNTDIGTSLDLW